MARKHCESCGGEYDEIQRDGSTYFHACAPRVVVRAALPDETIEERLLEDWRGLELCAGHGIRDARVAAGADPATLAVELARRTEDRPDKRDENTLRREGDRGELRVLKAEGRGARTIGPRADPPGGAAGAV